MRTSSRDLWARREPELAGGPAADGAAAAGGGGFVVPAPPPPAPGAGVGAAPPAPAVGVGAPPAAPAVDAAGAGAVSESAGVAVVAVVVLGANGLDAAPDGAVGLSNNEVVGAVEATVLSPPNKLFGSEAAVDAGG